MFKKFAIAALMVLALSVNAHACAEELLTVVTPKGTFTANTLVYLQDTHEWLVNMTAGDGHYFTTILPCNWVHIYEFDVEITEADAMTWDAPMED